MTVFPTFSPTVPPTLAPSTACGVPVWINGANYVNGDQVVFGGGIFTCTQKKLCRKSGPKFYESSGWDYVGLCESTKTPTESPTTPFPTFSPTVDPTMNLVGTPE